MEQVASWDRNLLYSATYKYNNFKGRISNKSESPKKQKSLKTLICCALVLVNNGVVQICLADVVWMCQNFSPIYMGNMCRYTKPILNNSA